MTEKRTVSPLFTDLYELTMGNAYFENRMFSEATFSLYIRDCPSHRNYFVAAGLEDLLRIIPGIRFSETDLDYLKSQGIFSGDFLQYLKAFRFSGDIYALPEGAIFFKNEPVLEITGPLIESQLLETLVLNAIGFPVLAASKAARCVEAAAGKSVVDFSLRRTQGQDSGMKASRSSYIAGVVATSNVLAGKMYHIPISGTMAHSFVLSFADEISAFRAYAESFPQDSVFLIDTFDTLKGAEYAVTVAREMEEKGFRLKGVRLDSGDMIDLSRKVRKILDKAGLKHVSIIASSGFEEYQIRGMVEGGAEIDAFGVGTKLGVSSDAPYLDIVYKMVRLGDKNVRKLSPGKITLAGEKQVFRFFDGNGLMERDIIGTRNESTNGASPLLEKVMEKGSPAKHLPSMEDIRRRFKENYSMLPECYKKLEPADPFPVSISEELHRIQP